MQTQKFTLPGNPKLQDWFTDPFWGTVKVHKSWFVISLLISLFLGQIYLRYKTPQYLITASLLIRDDSRGGDFQEVALLENLGLPTPASSVENEIEILKSRTLLARVIDDLNITIRYFAKGDLKTTELYEKTPFIIRFLKSVPDDPESCRFSFQNKDGFIIESSQTICKGVFGDTIRLNHCQAVIRRTRFKPATDCQYSFVLAPKEDILAECAKALTVAAPNKAASLVNLSIRNVLPEKGEAILKQLIIDYQKASIDEKNKIADNTISFINGNLIKVSSALAQVETDIEHFRRQNRVIDISEGSRQALQNFSRYDSEEKALTIRLQILDSLESHLHGHIESIIPSSLYQQESSFVDLAMKYNQVQVEHVKALVSLSNLHPDVTSIERQLEIIRHNLTAGIRHQKKELNISLGSIRKYRKNFNAEISHIPAQERRFVDKSREQSIQQELYLFLLKKRMETAISRSSNIPNARVIDPPKAGHKPVNPDKQLTLLISMLIGFVAPLSILYIKQIFNDRVSSKEEIMVACNANIVGELSQQPQPLTTTGKADSRSLLAEQFRTLRTNIQFIAESRQHKVILLTSAMAGEGKSFVGSHLIRSLALADKKVLLIDFDLRKPTLARNLQLEDVGVTDFLTNGTELTIQQAKVGFSFDFLASGFACANPAELLLSFKTKELIGSLRNKYDYILLDSPPVGLVADARILGRYADMTLYIIRQHFTFRHQLTDIQKMISDKQLPDVQLVVNGTKHLHSYQYSYYSDNHSHKINTNKHA